MVPDDDDEETCVKNDPQFFEHVHRQTYRLCVLACKRDGNNIRFVEPCFKKESLCLIAVEKTPQALAYLDADKQTLSVCYAAYKRDHFVYTYILSAEIRRKCVYLFKLYVHS